MHELNDADRMILLTELERARHGYGLAQQFAAEASERSASCGDDVTVRVSTDGTLTWSGHGCAVSMAAASAVGARTADEVRATAALFIASVEPGGAPLAGDLEPFAGIGRFPLRGRCATLAWRAAVVAIAAAQE